MGSDGVGDSSGEGFSDSVRWVSGERAIDVPYLRCGADILRLVDLRR